MEINYREKQQETHLPPGFRFHPTDEELITYYLLKRVVDSNFTSRAIAEVDLNKCEPWHLPGRAKMGEKEWYFFSLRDRKYPTGLRTNRATESGYWKATGKDREIYSSKSSGSTLVGMKKTLVFYKGRAPKGEKSNWVMHEYRLDGKFAYQYLSNNSKDEWVISRLFNKTGSGSSSAAGVNPKSIPEVSSPSSVSLPPLLDTSVSSTDRDISSYYGAIINTKEHVSCFSSMISAAPSFNHHSQILELPPPPPLMLPSSSPTSHFSRYSNGVSAFPSLWSLQENLQVPHFFSAVAPPPMYGGADHQMPTGYGSNTAAGQWVKVENQRMGPTELDCMWGY